MKKETIITILIIALTLGIGAVVAFTGGGTSDILTEPTELKREGAFAKGTEGAKVKIVEFADFQCPACKTASSTIQDVIDFYDGKVTFYYRHFPLSQHKFSELAARSAEAAGKQGKFWEMHDKVFENQSSLSNDSFEKFANELGLDIQKFKSDSESSEIKDIIAKDKKDGVNLKVNSTPTFFVNGEKADLKGYTLEDWKKVIDPKLTQ